MSAYKCCEHDVPFVNLCEKCVEIAAALPNTGTPAGDHGIVKDESTGEVLWPAASLSGVPTRQKVERLIEKYNGDRQLVHDLRELLGDSASQEGMKK